MVKLHKQYHFLSSTSNAQIRSTVSDPDAYKWIMIKTVLFINAFGILSSQFCSSIPSFLLDSTWVNLSRLF